MHSENLHCLPYFPSMTLPISEYKPSQECDIQRLHQFGQKMRSGIVLGCVQHVGGGWSGDLYIADWKQIEEARRRTYIYTKRFKVEEVEFAWETAVTASLLQRVASAYPKVLENH